MMASELTTDSPRAFARQIPLRARIPSRSAATAACLSRARCWRPFWQTAPSLHRAANSRGARSYEELKAWHERSGLPLKKFFNTSGLLYKSLNLKDRLPLMTEEEQLRLLSSDGMLVKRPILVMEDRILVGFRESEWETVL